MFPRGLTKVQLASLFGVLGPLLTVHATDPLPATLLYVAITPDDFRIFGRAMRSAPFEIGRWKSRSYRASLVQGGLRLKLDLELDGLGRVRLLSGLHAFSHQVRPVFDLVVSRSSGPVMSA